MLIYPIDGHTHKHIDGPYPVFQLDFVEEVDRETIEDYKHSTFEIPYYIYSFHDDHSFISLPEIKDQVILVDFKNWVTDEDAARFIKPWTQAITFFQPKRIMTNWQALSHDESSFLQHSIIYENDNAEHIVSEPKPIRYSFNLKGYSDWRFLGTGSIKTSSLKRIESCSC